MVNDACMTESRREERILQLLRLLNLYLEKRKVRMIYLEIINSSVLENSRKGIIIALRVPFQMNESVRSKIL